MRAQFDPWFFTLPTQNWNGIEETVGDDYVCLLDDIVIGYIDDEDSVNKLIHEMFPSSEKNARSTAYMNTLVILSTKNAYD